MRISRLAKSAAATLLFSAITTAATTYDYNLSVLPTGGCNTGSTVCTWTDSGNPNLPISGIETNSAQGSYAGPGSTNWTMNNTWTVNPDVTPTALYGKISAGNSGETGLGLNLDPNSSDHEFWANPAGGGTNPSTERYGFVQLNVTSILANSAIKFFAIQIGSSQTDEFYAIYGSNTPCTSTSCSGTLLNYNGAQNFPAPAPANAQTPFFDVPDYGTYDYYWIAAAIGPNNTDGYSNVLLDAQLTFSSVNPVTPEPSSYGLAGLSLLGAVFLTRKFRKP